jgi:hypothetical protein
MSQADAPQARAGWRHAGSCAPRMPICTAMLLSMRVARRSFSVVSTTTVEWMSTRSWAQLPVFGQRMFGNDFLFAVTRDFVASCAVPMLVMLGDDVVHPAEISADIVRRAPHAEVVAPWKGEQHKADAMRRAAQFLLAH